MCLCVCSLSPPRSFDGSSPNLLGVCRWTSHLPLRGSFRKGQRVTFTFHYIIYAPASRHIAAKGTFCFAVAAESNSAPFAALHLNGVCRWTSQLPLRGSFSKRSAGRRVDGSMGQMGRWVTSRRCMQVDLTIALEGFCFEKVNRSTAQRVTFTFTILYMIADDARLMPPCCKKHTAYDDTRLTPHHCKKHTASFARSTGKFPSTCNKNIRFKMARSAMLLGNCLC